jgi:hypothetical protein
VSDENGCAHTDRSGTRDLGVARGAEPTADCRRGDHYLQFTAKSDGKDYPEYSDDIVAELIASGTPTTRSYSERIVDAYVTEWTDKVNGKVTASGKKTVSKDGRTLTISVDGTSQIRVYDRQ